MNIRCAIAGAKFVCVAMVFERVERLYNALEDWLDRLNDKVEAS